jgi:hypothetical protein
VADGGTSAAGFASAAFGAAFVFASALCGGAGGGGGGGGVGFFASLVAFSMTATLMSSALRAPFMDTTPTAISACAPKLAR